MTWMAHTGFRELKVGTTLHLTERTIVGYPASPLEEGASVPIELGTGARTSFTLVKVAPGQVFVQLPDRSIWKMTPHTPNDFPVGIVSPGLNSQDWVIRSRAQALE